MSYRDAGEWVGSVGKTTVQTGRHGLFAVKASIYLTATNRSLLLFYHGNSKKKKIFFSGQLKKDTEQ